MEMSEEFLNWCEGKWEDEFKVQRLFSKLSNEDIDFLKEQHKADMVAMLEVIKLRIDNLPEPLNRDRVNYCVQEKINNLKGNEDGNK